jgi:hypothetical protein
LGKLCNYDEVGAEVGTGFLYMTGRQTTEIPMENLAIPIYSYDSHS